MSTEKKCPRCGQEAQLTDIGLCDPCVHAECWEAGGHVEQIDAAKSRAEKAEGLLREWFAWWDQDASGPAKMPNGLHIKTAVHFATAGELLPVSGAAAGRGTHQ